MNYTTKVFMLVLLCLTLTVSAQDEEENQGSVIQTLTPSKLIRKGQFDIKWFNNLYTQTESTFTDGTEPRETFFLLRWKDIPE